MSQEEKFLRNMVADDRSFSTETLKKACRILQNPKKGVVIDQESVDKFTKMVERVSQMRNEIDEEEVSYTI